VPWLSEVLKTRGLKKRRHPCAFDRKRVRCGDGHHHHYELCKNFLPVYCSTSTVSMFLRRSSPVPSDFPLSHLVSIFCHPLPPSRTPPSPMSFSTVVVLAAVFTSGVWGQSNTAQCGSGFDWVGGYLFFINCGYTTEHHPLRFLPACSCVEQELLKSRSMYCRFYVGCFVSRAQ
jgi:hypothetical protein